MPPAPPPPWKQRWRLIVTVGELAPKERDALQRALFWQGFGTLGRDCFVHPGADLRAAFDALLAEGLADTLGQLKPLLAADLQFGTAASNVDIVNGAWKLDRLAGVYESFLERYQPVLHELCADADIVDESAFLLRILLIHERFHDDDPPAA